MSTLHKTKLLISGVFMILGLVSVIYGMKLLERTIPLTENMAMIDQANPVQVYYYLGLAALLIISGAMILSSVKD